MDRTHLTHRRAGLSAAALSIAALLLSSTPAVGAVEEKAGWPRVATLNPAARYVTPVLAASPNGHWLSVAQRNPTGRPRDRAMLVRGGATGATGRVVYPVGDVLFTHIDRRGNAVVIGFSERGLVAVSWPRDRARPRTHEFGLSGYGNGFEVQTNAAGDIVAHFDGGRHVILRKLAGRPWQRPLRVGGLRYDGSELGDVDLDSRGRLIGAFLADDTVSLRRLGPHDRVFGPAHRVLSVPEYAGPHPGYGKHATITVGPGGDRLVTLSLRRFGEDLSRYGHAAIVPADGPRWDGEWSSGSFDDAVVGASGRVTVPLWEEPNQAEVIQWTPRRRTFEPLDGQWLRTSTPRGDLLLSDEPADGSWDVPAHLNLRLDGQRALDPVSARGAGTAPVAISGRSVFAAFPRGQADARYVLTNKSFRS